MLFFCRLQNLLGIKNAYKEVENGDWISKSAILTVCTEKSTYINNSSML